MENKEAVEVDFAICIYFNFAGSQTYIWNNVTYVLTL